MGITVYDNILYYEKVIEILVSKLRSYRYNSFQLETSATELATSECGTGLDMGIEYNFSASR